MPLFQILCRGQVIGHSKLEFDDAPMGVAHGQFIPNENYSDIQPEIIGTYGNQKHLCFTAFSEDGRLVPSDTIAINDRSAEFGLEGLYIELLVTTDLVYQEFFPHHVEAYEKRFPSAP